ncbi:MAG: ribbon-helix-helix domain-containing protein [Solirubrobacterales bacterium]|nr:ribbon-helix-helix domain-containing protein [Solirubrobacterales bacterium]
MSRLLSVSVSDDLADEIESLAEASGKTKSELVRDALRRQIRLERFSSLQRFGQSQAEAAGIGPEDVEGLIDQLRSE